MSDKEITLYIETWPGMSMNYISASNKRMSYGKYHNKPDGHKCYAINILIPDPNQPDETLTVKEFKEIDDKPAKVRKKK